MEFFIVKIHVFTCSLDPCCDVRNDFRVNTMFGARAGGRACLRACLEVSCFVYVICIYLGTCILGVQHDFPNYMMFLHSNITDAICASGTVSHTRPPELASGFNEVRSAQPLICFLCRILRIIVCFCHFSFVLQFTVFNHSHLLSSNFYYEFWIYRVNIKMWNLRYLIGIFPTPSDWRDNNYIITSYQYVTSAVNTHI